MAMPGEPSPTSGPQEHPLQDLESSSDTIKPLQSWMDDEPVATSAEGWDEGPVNAPFNNTPPKNRRLGNWLFGLALGTIALGASVLVSRAHSYNKSRNDHLRSIAVSIPHSAVAVDENSSEEVVGAISGHSGSSLVEENRAAGLSGYEASASSEEEPSPPKLIKHAEIAVAKEEAATAKATAAVAAAEEIIEEAETHYNKEKKKELEHSPGISEKTREELPVAGAVSEHTVKEEDSKFPEKAPEHNKHTTSKESSTTAIAAEKIPLRTPEGAAALERIRQVQARRRALYDRAIARHDDHEKPSQKAPEEKALGKEGNHNNKVNFSHKESHSAVEAPSITINHEHATTRGAPLYSQNEEGKDTSNKDVGMQTDDTAYIRVVAQQIIEQNESEELPPAEIPLGMSLEALRDRAKAANTAAAGAASAAHRAASASALATEAADKATHAAQVATRAAARCQSALDLRSVDAVEAAYHAAIEAEETASAAVRRAAVGSAKALIGKHDAERKAQTAATAADLSAPRGVVDRAAAAMRQGRRQVVAAAREVQDGVVAVGEAGKRTASSVVDKGRGTFEAVRQAIGEAVTTVRENVSSIKNNK